MVSRTKLTVSAAVLFALAACGGRGKDNEIVRQGNDAFENSEARVCLANLKSSSVKFQALPNQTFSGGCRTIDTVKLMDFGTLATNLGPMTCPLAASFTAWARHAVNPAARQYLGSEVVRIETMGTYSCRNVNGGRSGQIVATCIW